MLGNVGGRLLCNDISRSLRPSGTPRYQGGREQIYLNLSTVCHQVQVLENVALTSSGVPEKTPPPDRLPYLHSQRRRTLNTLRETRRSSSHCSTQKISSTTKHSTSPSLMGSFFQPHARVWCLTQVIMMAYSDKTWFPAILTIEV